MEKGLIVPRGEASKPAIAAAAIEIIIGVMVSSPAVLFSSTFYDLKQVRADLVDFISEQLGFTPLAFEDSSFPVDPDVTTIENCRRRVERDADMMVLVIGGRSGEHEVSSGKSITNLEYLAARAKGIPVYVFIDKQVLAHYENWKRNPENSFAGCVDDVRLFDFIRLIREEHKAWSFHFERAQDIVGVLRKQLAHLSKESLAQRMLLRAHTDQEALHGLHGAAYRIALELPRGWEYRLLTQLLNDEIRRLSAVRDDYKRGFVLGIGHRVLANDSSWISDRLHELSGAADQLSRLINEGSKEAVGPLGEAGSIQKIRHLVRRVGEIYEYGMAWTQNIRKARFPTVMKPCQVALCKFSASLLDQIEHLAAEMTNVVSTFDDKFARGEPINFRLVLELQLEGGEEFDAALEAATRQVAMNPSLANKYD